MASIPSRAQQALMRAILDGDDATAAVAVATFKGDINALIEYGGGEPTILLDMDLQRTQGELDDPSTIRVHEVPMRPTPTVGMLPIVAATSTKKIQTLAALAARGDVNPNAYDAAGTSALYWAAVGNPDKGTPDAPRILAALVHYFPLINLRQVVDLDTGSTVLHVVLSWGMIHEAAWILRHGAQLEATDRSGATCIQVMQLHCAPSAVYWLERVLKMQKGALTTARRQTYV